MAKISLKKPRILLEEVPKAIKLAEKAKDRSFISGLLSLTWGIQGW